MFVFRENGLYWGGAEGWGDLSHAKYFNGDEPETLALPVSCEMLELWEIDELQFARFIAELEAAGGVTENIKQAMCTSMDLEPGDFDALLERAIELWEKSKDKIKKGA